MKADLKSYMRITKWMMPYIGLKVYALYLKFSPRNSAERLKEFLAAPSVRPKILIWNFPAHVGNSVIAFSLVKAIKLNFAGAIVHMVTTDVLKPLMELNGDIEKIFDYNDEWIGGNFNDNRLNFKERLDFIRKLKSNSYDISIDLTFGSWYCMFFTVMAGIKFRFGFLGETDRRKGLLTYWVKDRRMDLRYEKSQALQILDLIKPYISKESSGYSMEHGEALINEREKKFREFSISENEFVVGIHPGADWANKRWDISNFAELAKFFKKNYNARILITGGPGEVEIAAELKRLLDGDALNLAGKLNLLELAAVIGGLDFFAVNNTGPMHIAAALGTPFIGITGPSPASWNPISKSGKVIRAAVDCRPCDWKDCANPGGNICITGITPDLVIAEAKKLMRDGGVF